MDIILGTIIIFPLIIMAILVVWFFVDYINENNIFENMAFVLFVFCQTIIDVMKINVLSLIYPHRVYLEQKDYISFLNIPESNKTVCEEWIKDQNISGRYLYLKEAEKTSTTYHLVFCFRHKVDAMAFKIVWS